MRKPSSENDVIKTVIAFLLAMLALFIAYMAIVFVLLYSKS